MSCTSLAQGGDSSPRRREIKPNECLSIFCAAKGAHKSTRNKTPLVMQSGSRQGPQTLKYESENCNKHARSLNIRWMEKGSTNRCPLPGLRGHVARAAGAPEGQSRGGGGGGRGRNSFIEMACMIYMNTLSRWSLGMNFQSVSTPRTFLGMDY